MNFAHNKKKLMVAALGLCMIGSLDSCKMLRTQDSVAVAKQKEQIRKWKNNGYVKIRDDEIDEREAGCKTTGKTLFMHPSGEKGYVLGQCLKFYEYEQEIMHE
ncbi:MAG: hypothetical protein ABR981_00940 [Candidatus Micrarchaeaceae archaeon]|jgi:hypothetical protein